MECNHCASAAYYAYDFHARLEAVQSAADSLMTTVQDSLRHAMTLAREKGASTWLTSLPLEEHGFSLHKGAFRDALALRYGWLPSNTPTSCACGKSLRATAIRVANYK